MRIDCQPLWTVPAAALVLVLSASAGQAASQCETMKQQFNACAQHGHATLLPKGDTMYIRRCLDRFPYPNFCMSALPDGSGQNDPDGFVYAPEPTAGGSGQVLDTSLRDRLRARLDGWGRKTAPGARADWPGTQACAFRGPELICQTEYAEGRCRTTYMLPGDGGRSRTEEGCDLELFAGATAAAPAPPAAEPQVDPEVDTKEECEARGDTWARRDLGPGWPAPGANRPASDVWQCYVKVSLEDPEAEYLRNEIKFLLDGEPLR